MSRYIMTALCLLLGLAYACGGEEETSTPVPGGEWTSAIPKVEMTCGARRCL
jgi:hypothetical protein